MALRRLGWACMSLAALALYLFHNGAGTQLLLGAVVFIPLAEGLAFLLSRPGLSLHWELPAGIERGRELSGVLPLAQTGGLPSPILTGKVCITNLLTGERRELPLSQPLSGGRAELSLSLRPDHCGLITFQLKNLRLWDGFGLFCKKIEPEAGPQLLAEPRITPLSLRVEEFWRDSDRYSTLRPGSDPSETFRIRDYVPGDPIRQIHWKLSEKVDKPLVRDYGLPLGERVLLTLEEAPATADEVDAALDLLFSVGQALTQLDHPATVAWPAGGAYESMDLYSGEDWLVFRHRLLSAPLAPVRLQMDGMTIL